MSVRWKFLWAAVAVVGSVVSAQAEKLTADVAVVGGGSAGFGAAWNAARCGSSVVLVERGDKLGGTSVLGGVSCWEPDCAGEGTPHILYDRLHAQGAAGVYVIDRHCCWDDPKKGVFPGGLNVIDPNAGYGKTLRRHGPGMGAKDWFRENCRGVIFDPDAMAATMKAMLEETGNCRILLKTSFVSAERTADGTVTSLTLSDGTVIRPKVVVDACGAVCKAIGCRVMTSDRPNGATLVYRVAYGEGGRLPEELSAKPAWGCYAACSKLPNGEIIINMLPTMSGEEATGMSREAAYAECRRRVFGHWAWLKQNWPGFAPWRIVRVSDEVACRETFRIEGEYVLTGEDVMGGVRPADEIATADHMLDSHGVKGAPCGELKQPYGIPYRCLLPKGTSNVLVAGRCASFDTVAASSCRLSRAMMRLGEAAGLAAHESVVRGIPLRDVKPGDLKRPVTKAAVPPHRRFVLADESRAKVHLYDSCEPSANFEIPVEKPVWDLKKMRDGVYRIVCKKGFMIVDLFARKVVETFRHESLDEVTAVCDLPDGGFICSVNPPGGSPDYRKVVLIRRFSSARELVDTYRLDGLFYARTMNPDREPWGYLLAWEHGFIRFRIDPKTGACETVKSYPQPVGRNLFDVETDRTGAGYWAGIGYGGELIHFATDGEMLSRWRNPSRSHFFAQMREMPDGGVYMAQWTGHGENDSQKGCQVLQFDRNGRIVWTLDDPDRFGSISGIDVLDAPEMNQR